MIKKIDDIDEFKKIWKSTNKKLNLEERIKAVCKESEEACDQMKKLAIFTEQFSERRNKITDRVRLYTELSEFLEHNYSPKELQHGLELLKNDITNKSKETNDKIKQKGKEVYI